jgi:acyl-CoA thioesterase-2
VSDRGTNSTDSNLTDFADLIELEASAAGFVGPASPERTGLMYGGQFLAQAMAAALRTADDDRVVHSLHGLFLRGGDVDQPTNWDVDVVRDGRSFGTRSVSGFQDGPRGSVECFRATISLHVPEVGLEHQPALDFDFDAVPDPDDVPMTYVEFCHAHPDTAASEWAGADRPMEIRYIDPPDPAGGGPTEAPQRTWTRIAGHALGDDPAIHQAALAYLSDATLIDHVLLPHGHRWSDARLTGVSLDHAMWFHRPCRADQWLLFDQRVESTGGARGLTTGRFYDRAGALVATCAQEGLMRWNDALTG